MSIKVVSLIFFLLGWATVLEAQEVTLLRISGCTSTNLCFFEKDGARVFCRSSNFGQCPSASECLNNRIITDFNKSSSFDYSGEINEIIDRRNAFVETSHQRLLAIQQYEFAHTRLRMRLSEIVGIANDDKKFDDTFKGREDRIYYEQSRVDLALEQVFDAKARLLYELQYVRGKLSGHDDLLKLYQNDLEELEKKLDEMKKKLLERRKKATGAIDKWIDWKYRLQLQGRLDLTRSAIDRKTFERQTQSYRTFLEGIEKNFHATRLGNASRAEMEALIHQYRVMATNTRSILAPMLSCSGDLEKSGSAEDCKAKKREFDDLVSYAEVKLIEINKSFKDEILPLYIDENKRDLDIDGSPLNRGRQDHRSGDLGFNDGIGWVPLEPWEPLDNIDEGRSVDRNDDRHVRHSVSSATDRIDRINDGQVRASYPIRREDQMRSELRDAHRRAMSARMDYPDLDDEIANLGQGIQLALTQTGDQGLAQLRDEVNRFQSDKNYYNGKVNEYSQRMKEQHNGFTGFANDLTSEPFPDSSTYDVPSTSTLPSEDELNEYTRALADISIGLSPVGPAYDVANAGYAMIFDQTLLGDPVDQLDKTILALGAMPFIPGALAKKFKAIAEKLIKLAKSGGSDAIRAIKIFYSASKDWVLDALAKKDGVRHLKHLHSRALELFDNVPSSEKLGNYLEMMRKTARTQGMSSMGKATRKESEFLRDMWVGSDAVRRPYDGKPGKFIWVSKDGLKVYREPILKRNQGKVQANFEWRLSPNDSWHNGHLDIVD